MAGREEDSRERRKRLIFLAWRRTCERTNGLAGILQSTPLDRRLQGLVEKLPPIYEEYTADFKLSPSEAGEFQRAVEAFAEELEASGRPTMGILRLCFWLPRSYREAVLGDLLEDCREYVSNGATKRRIQWYVSWVILRLIAYSWSAALVWAMKRVFSTK